MPYKLYNPKEIEKITTDTTQQKSVYKPPAISGSKPVAPNKKSKPFPTPFSSDKMDNKPEVDESMDEGKEKDALNKTSDGKITKKGKRYDKKRWLGGKANKNASLRRMIFPKAPWTILEELSRNLQIEVNFNYLEPVEEDGMKLFPCEVIVNGDTYHGTAPDQDISRNIAAETAIQAYVVHVVNNGPPDVEVTDPIDNAPWAALASLGLFKLFNDWESRGFAIPLQQPPIGMAPKAPSSGSGAQPDFVHKPCKKLPDNPTSKHPVMLINEVYPGSTFFVGNRGQDEMYSVAIEINGQQFVGRGRNKKDAKKDCAVAAAKALLNIEY